MNLCYPEICEGKGRYIIARHQSLQLSLQVSQGQETLQIEETI